MKALVAGYGTLLSRESLARTLGEAAVQTKRFVPVWIEGHRRLFNVRPPYYRGTAPSAAEAAHNLEPAAGARCNAVVFLATLDELALLDDRERGYERTVVALHTFEDSQPFGRAFAYLAPPDSAWIERDPARLQPFPRDLDWSRAGAAALGPEFLAHFEATTFLADGRTPLAIRTIVGE
jgi:gamma-glutamylcyclotransferase (GGCT)/AIG2-like uncharacterized protein YtfP